MARKTPPVTSFGPELQEALRRGSTSDYTITLESEAVAIRFAHRLNSLRAAMRSEDHPDWRQLYRTSVRRRGSQVMIGPQDSQFASALRDALESLPSTTPTPTPNSSESVSADSFLAGLGKPDDKS